MLSDAFHPVDRVTIPEKLPVQMLPAVTGAGQHTALDVLPSEPDYEHPNPAHGRHIHAMYKAAPVCRSSARMFVPSTPEHRLMILAPLLTQCAARSAVHIALLPVDSSESTAGNIHGLRM